MDGDLVVVMLKGNEKRIRARLERLPPPAPAVFAAACARRLFTGYQRYEAITGAAGSQVLDASDQHR
jgi:hypothetical protein